MNILLNIKQVSLMEELLVDVKRGLGFRRSLRTLQEEGLIDQEFAVRHQRYLLTEKYWIIVEVVSIILVH